MYAFYPYQLSNANAFKVREQSGRKALGLEACSNSSSLRWTRGFKAPNACFNGEGRIVFKSGKVLQFFLQVFKALEDLNDDRQE